MGTSTYKTSTIFVSTGKKKQTRVFRSMEELPAKLRDKLHANISGPNSRTLIVADRRGREYLIRTLKRATRQAAASVQCQPRSVRTFAVRERWKEAKKYWLEIGLIGLLGVASWILAHWT
jgi:hypothetical protein